MTKEQKLEVLELLVEVQFQCSKITLSIGSVVDNFVYHDTIVIKDCPPVVISKLVEKGYLLSLDSNGLNVFKY